MNNKKVNTSKTFSGIEFKKKYKIDLYVIENVDDKYIIGPKSEINYAKTCFEISINVPDDASISIHNNLFITNKINIENKRDWTTDSTSCTKILSENGMALQQINIDQSLTNSAVYETALLENGLAIQFVPKEKQSFDLQMIAVMNNILSLEHIYKQSREVVMYCINKSVTSEYFKYVKNQMEYAYEAIQKNPFVLQHIINPTNDMCEQACKLDGRCLQFIPKHLQTEKQQMFAVTQAGWSLEYTFNPSRNVKITAIQNNPMSIQYLNLQSEEYCLLALSKCTFAINVIDEMFITPNIIEYILKSDEYTTNNKFNKINKWLQYEELSHECIEKIFNIVMKDFPNYHHQILEMFISVIKLKYNMSDILNLAKQKQLLLDTEHNVLNKISRGELNINNVNNVGMLCFLDC